MSPTVTINGEERTVSDGLSLRELVARETEDEFDHVAVALNGEIVSRDSWDDVVVESGDDVEIVQPIQGGDFARRTG